MKRRSYMKSHSPSKGQKNIGRVKHHRNCVSSTDMDDNDYVEKQRDDENENEGMDDDEQDEATEDGDEVDDSDDDSEEEEIEEDDDEYGKPEVKRRGRRPNSSKNMKKFSRSSIHRNNLSHHSRHKRDKDSSSEYKATSSTKHDHEKKGLFHLRLQLRPLETTPRKLSKASESNRNTQKKPLNTTEAQKFQAESFVMKLFDRSLDLSKYNDKTPLYPICRAWMCNQPRNPQVSQFQHSGNHKPTQRMDNCGEVLAQLKDGELSVIKEMPKPKKTDESEISAKVSPRVYSVKENIIPDNNELENADRETIFAWHRNRWQNVRENWQNKALKYRQRYTINLMILHKLCKADLITSETLQNITEARNAQNIRIL